VIGTWKPGLMPPSPKCQQLDAPNTAKRLGFDSVAPAFHRLWTNPADVHAAVEKVRVFHRSIGLFAWAKFR
jgi:hypothetical protein